MDHYQYPRNKRKIDDPSYQKIHMDSSSCIDDIYVYVLLENDTIKDIAFDGVACTIATSSTSIMTELVKGKKIDAARVIIQNYFDMIYEKPYDADILEEANVFKFTYKQANRIHCATIGWNGLTEILDKNK